MIHTQKLSDIPILDIRHEISILEILHKPIQDIPGQPHHTTPPCDARSSSSSACCRTAWCCPPASWRSRRGWRWWRWRSVEKKIGSRNRTSMIFDMCQKYVNIGFRYMLRYISVMILSYSHMILIELYENKKHLGIRIIQDLSWLKWLNYQKPSKQQK